MVVPSPGNVPCRSIAAWRDTWRQLAKQARTAECDVRRDLQGHAQRAWSQALASDLRGSWTAVEGERQVWEKELWAGLGQLRQRVAVLGTNLRFANGSEDVRKMVSSVEHKIQVYAEQARQQHEELAAEECSLHQALQASLARFEAWTQETAPRPAPRRRAKSCDGPPQGQALRSRVAQLTEQLAPSRGGWSREDHEAFARLLLGRFRGRACPAFLEEAQLLLPGKSHEALVAHGKWIYEQEALHAERRQLVAAWREQQEAENEKLRDEPVEDAIQERQARAAKMERTKQECQERKKQVEAWRREREEKRAAAAERLAAEKRQKAESLKAKQLRRGAQQEELRAFQQRRAAEKAAECLAAPTESRRLSPRERQRIAARSQSLLRQREQQRQEAVHRRTSFEPPPRVSSYPHVESRLWIHTEEFVDRARSLQETQELEKAAVASKYGIVPGNFAHQALVRTVRAVPSWRLSVAGA